MADHMIELHHDNNTTDVFITNERIEPGGSYLLVKFTSEGIIMDHVTKDGSILATSCKMYDEVIDSMEPNS